MKYLDNLFIKEKKFNVYLYHPKISRLFFGNLRKMDFHEYVRFILMFLRGYEIYYLSDFSEKLIGYCVVTKGIRGGGRYPFSNQNDVLIGPYYVVESVRGFGLSTKLMMFIFSRIEYSKAWCWIQKDNEASIRSALHAGFSRFGSARYTKILRKLVFDSDGEYFVFVKTRN